MQKEAQYSDPASQEALGQWLEAAEKEAVYADDNMQKLYSRGVGKFQKYKDNVHYTVYCGIQCLSGVVTGIFQGKWPDIAELSVRCNQK